MVNRTILGGNQIPMLRHTLFTATLYYQCLWVGHTCNNLDEIVKSRSMNWRLLFKEVNINYSNILNMILIFDFSEFFCGSDSGSRYDCNAF